MQNLPVQATEIEEVQVIEKPTAPKPVKAEIQAPAKIEK